MMLLIPGILSWLTVKLLRRMMLLDNNYTTALKNVDAFFGILLSIRQQISLYATTLQCNRYNWWKSETLFFSQVNWESCTMPAWREFFVTIYLVWLTYSPVCYTWYSGTRLWTVAGRVVACPLSTSITGSPNKEHIIGTAHWGTHQEEHIIGETSFLCTKQLKDGARFFLCWTIMKTQRWIFHRQSVI